MFLVTRSKEARGPIHLRDTGDGKMKEVGPKGALFKAAPRLDPEVEVVELSTEQVKAHLAGEDKAKKVLQLAELKHHKERLEARLKEATAVAEDAMKKAEDLEKELKEASAALEEFEKSFAEKGKEAK